MMSIQDLLQKSTPTHLLVIGDLILDRYYWGVCTRVSPEAPVPVLQAQRLFYRPGGAGAVACMAAGLGAKVSLISAIGQDRAGLRLISLLLRLGIETQSVFGDRNRITTVKTRFWAASPGRPPQQLLRLDREKSNLLTPESIHRLQQAISAHLSSVQAVLVADYGKGVCTPELLESLIVKASLRGVPVLIDPARGVDFRRYAGASCLLPNRQEAGAALKMSISGPPEGLQAARTLLDQYDIQVAVVKLDRQGLVWAARKPGPSAPSQGYFPAQARRVHDVTGAGDMVLAVLGWAMAQGADWPTALELANLAAGIKVGLVGCRPISREVLLARIAPESKIVSLPVLQAALARHRQKGRRIVLTNGCFDLLHPGHLATLEFARRQGDVLVVAVNTDRSVRSLKGPGRPILPQQDRAKMLAALACVDYVILFDTESVQPLVEQLRPDVLVKGGKEDPTLIRSRRIVESYGGKFLLGPSLPGYSTSHLLAEIRQGAGVE